MRRTGSVILSINVSSSCEHAFLSELYEVVGRSNIDSMPLGGTTRLYPTP
jgi:hypothetical protein